VGDVIEPFLGNAAEVGALGQVLPEQTIGVLVDAMRGQPRGRGAAEFRRPLRAISRVTVECA